MARKVFFSFHFGNDISRANNVRNAWAVGPTHEKSPLIDKAGWENVKRGGDEAIKNWIDNAMSGCGVTVVLIGQQTHNRPWVQYEIAKSFIEKMGVIGICLRGMKNFDKKSFTNAGPNPFQATKEAYDNEFNIPNYPTYSWVHDDGRNNIESWIEQAAKRVGR